MESLTRLLNAAHMLQGKVIALLGDMTPDASDIEAVGDIIAQCSQIYADYLEEVARNGAHTPEEVDDDPNRTALIGDDEALDADPNRTAIIENTIDPAGEVELATEPVADIEPEPAAQPEEVAEVEAVGELEDIEQPTQESIGVPDAEPADDFTLDMLPIDDEEPEAAPVDVAEDNFISLDELTEEEDTAGAPIRVDELLQHRIVAGDIRRAFTLNDKYRFRRELFGNSDVALNDALDVVSAMHSFDEVCEYFSADLGWDLENDDVKDFLDVIATHFR